jgi:hypothetical protein
VEAPKSLVSRQEVSVSEKKMIGGTWWGRGSNPSFYLYPPCPVFSKSILFPGMQTMYLWKCYILNVFKNKNHINRYYIIIPGSFYSQFQILSNCLVDNEKHLALYFLLLCQSVYHLSAWAILGEKNPTTWIAICPFMNAEESAFCLISAWKPMNKGYL